MKNQTISKPVDQAKLKSMLKDIEGSSRTWHGNTDATIDIVNFIDRIEEKELIKNKFDDELLTLHTNLSLKISLLKADDEAINKVLDKLATHFMKRAAVIEQKIN